MEFMATLTKEKFEPTPAILKGYAFEDAITAYCEIAAPPDNEAVREIGDLVKGGLWQQKVSADLPDVLGMKIRLSGVADVIKGDTIYDIKRAGSYDIGKYAESLQHLIYLHCTQIPKFRYCIGYGSGENPSGVAYEDYSLDAKTLPTIKQKCAELLGWLDNSNLLQIYKKHWYINE